MATPEGEVLAAITAWAKTVPGLRLSRNMSGMTQSHLPYGCFRPGGSDLIGWYTVDGFRTMFTHRGDSLTVGGKVATFVALEVKAPKSKTKPELLAAQTAFLKEVRDAGGIAGFVTSVEEAAALLGVRV
jgi:hypothetical protein